MLKKWTLGAAAVLVLLLGVSYLVRQHVGAARCGKYGLVYREGHGCIPDPASIMLQRDIRRS